MEYVDAQGYVDNLVRDQSLSCAMAGNRCAYLTDLRADLVEGEPAVMVAWSPSRLGTG